MERGRLQGPLLSQAATVPRGGKNGVCSAAHLLHSNMALPLTVCLHASANSKHANPSGLWRERRVQDHLALHGGSSCGPPRAPSLELLGLATKERLHSSHMPPKWKLVPVYPKFQFNWVSCICLGSPTPGCEAIS